jgi:hypothetical protein
MSRANNRFADAASRLRPKYEECLKLSVLTFETAWSHIDLSEQITSVCFDANADLVCIGGSIAQIRSAATGTLRCWTRVLPGMKHASPTCMPTSELVSSTQPTLSSLLVPLHGPIARAEGEAPCCGCIIERLSLSSQTGEPLFIQQVSAVFQ